MGYNPTVPVPQLRMQKPYSAACDRNRDPILAVLRRHLADRTNVLEVGSGTGQHAVHFAHALPHLCWQTSDVAENLGGISAWLREAALSNTPPPLELDIDKWEAGSRYSGKQTTAYDALFSANTLHILSWPQVQRLFAYILSLLTEDALVTIYGPFNYGGNFTSESNAAFNEWLQARGAHMAIRDFEAVDRLAAGIGLRLIDDVAMPSNNRLLIWRRQTGRIDT
jgi:hypothetical protein